MGHRRAPQALRRAARRMSSLRVASRVAPAHVAKYDSATAMVRALGRYLHGRDFPMLGMAPVSLRPLTAVNALPVRLREELAIRAGAAEAIAPQRIGRVRAEDISRWVVAQYPDRRYPAVLIGSSNGAAVHLCAALGIPWLPQTFLLPVRHPRIHPDEPGEAMAWARGPAEELLGVNPDLQLHHMWDPNQDRLMLQRMTYFRVKRLSLGETYSRFLGDRVEPGGTVLVLDCRLRWPTTFVDERHVFQHGALGGATPEEFISGSRRVEDYLARYGSHRRRWEPPAPDRERPEAEWGFEPSLGEDVARLARRNGWQVRSITFDAPEDLSPLVADMHRRWYAARGMPTDRLLLESFMLLEPWWALRTGSVPFWMVFNMEPSLERATRYVDATAPLAEMHLMLFSHGVDSVGLPTIDRWRSLLSRARTGAFAGVDEKAFPRDFASVIRYHTDIRKIPARHPMPGPLTLDRLDAFVEAREHPVGWLDPLRPPTASTSWDHR